MRVVETPMEWSVLFLAKRDDEHCTRALEFCQRMFASVCPLVGDWGDPFPEEAKAWIGDLVLSLRSRWIVPETVLERARIAALNFHPAPPEYPGIGCVNFALYDEASEYGVTSHHMAPTVDTGDIVAVSRFPVLSSDDVASLLSRTNDYQLVQFYEVLKALCNGALPKSDERWARAPYTRDELNRLACITTDMTREESERRVRATSFGRWKPVIETSEPDRHRGSSDS